MLQTKPRLPLQLAELFQAIQLVHWLHCEELNPYGYEV